jgi:hypothetical protein
MLKFKILIVLKLSHRDGTGVLAGQLEEGALGL